MKTKDVSSSLSFAVAILFLLPCSVHTIAARADGNDAKTNKVATNKPAPTNVAKTSAVQAAPIIRIVVPERFRLLTNQLFDLRVEASGFINQNARLQIYVNGENRRDALPDSGTQEITTNNDADPNTFDKAWTLRRINFNRPGTYTVQAVVTSGRAIYGAATQIVVQDFSLVGRKNIILYIGDAMGTAYRDAGRIVAQSTNNRFREGFFDELQQMDQMPVTGMVMTYGLDQVVPDSANSGTAWASGNKTIDGALNVFPDNNDFRYNPTNTTTQQATKQFALDNPRVETLWEYLKRLYGYKTGIVTTSEVTDATPAAQGGHTIARALQNDIARQYVDGVFTNAPSFDVIMGGAKERFLAASTAAPGASRPSAEGIAGGRTVANSGDTRNLVGELEARGYSFIQSRTELNALPTGANAPERIIGLFRTGNMNVAYDKLALPRPADEPAPNFNNFTDQPYLDEMTDKAIAALSKSGAPFVLMVEGASIDKQSHPNLAAGQIWDTIELDKAVGVGRTYLNANTQTRANTLVLVTADHDQSMSIIGAVDTQAAGAPAGGAIQNVISTLAYPNGNRGSAGNVAPENRVGESEGFPDYNDANGDRYPENDNRLRIKVGYRTGNHTGSSVPLTAEGTGALLFYGYYDQTDIFFKMARVLSINTTDLDRAVATKAAADVAPPPVVQQLRSYPRIKEQPAIEFLPRTPLTQPHLMTGEDTHHHDADEPKP